MGPPAHYIVGSVMDHRAMEEIKSWLNVKDTAAALGISRQATYPYLEDGRIRAIKTANGYLCDPQSVRRMASDLERERQGRRAGNEEQQ